jgi:cell division protease FtsH
MVTQYGMSEILGPQQLGQKETEIFLGRDYGHQANYSNEVANHIDEEVRNLIESAHATANSILTTHRTVLDELAAALIEKETLDTPELMEIIGHLPKWNGVNGKANGSTRKRVSRSTTPKTDS